MQRSLRIASHLPVESVTDLVRRLRGYVESSFGEVWVAGEISNFRIPASGHFYFCLKDKNGQISAVMFRSATRVLPFKPRDGLEVIVHGRVSIYEVRGDLQLYVDAMEPCGIGSAQLALQQLKQRLAEEGLFDVERKRPLPFWPRAVGVVTAAKGAAIHDIVTILRQRLPAVRIVMRAVRVQGKEAGADIAAALGEMNAVADVDVIIVGRGGGSLEDLWAFNEERVVRAMAASKVPTVSAVGHEIDVTLADLVADQRAATPTAAAALVVPDHRELNRQLARAAADMQAALLGSVVQRRERLGDLRRRLRDPRDSIRSQRLRIDELGERARRAVDGCLRTARQQCGAKAERLHALSPLAVLQRGYAIVRHLDDGAVVRAADQTSPGQQLRVTLARGWLQARVEALHLDDE
jgi:exodeoxyribonuclease VII large subunit